jgi:hypothetical protein
MRVVFGFVLGSLRGPAGTPLAEFYRLSMAAIGPAAVETGALTPDEALHSSIYQSGQTSSPADSST